MVNDSDIRHGMCILEVGAGTGPMTAELIRRGHTPDLVLEPCDDLRAVLLNAHPSINVVADSVADLANTRSEHAMAPFDRVVSSLPWANWSQNDQNIRLDAILDNMTNDGRMVTFTYAHTAMLPKARRFRSVLLERFQTVTISPVVWKNTPPAMVYRCQR
jgi:phospholipid N-methyltransferase